MHTEFHIFRVFLAVTFIITNLYLIAGWCFVLMRTGLMIAWLFAASHAASLIVSIIYLMLMLAARELEELFGPDLYYAVYWMFLSLQPMHVLLGVIGSTLLFRLLLTRQQGVASPQPPNQD